MDKQSVLGVATALGMQVETGMGISALASKTSDRLASEVLSAKGIKSSPASPFIAQRR